MENAGDHLPLAPHAFEILLSLSSAPRHGYGVIRDVRERTGDQVVIGTSSLYATVRRLLKAGLVEDAGDQPAGESEGPPRRYYRITALGLEVVRAEARRLRETAAAAESLLGDAVAGPRNR